jgi:hypothetical protein
MRRMKQWKSASTKGTERNMPKSFSQRERKLSILDFNHLLATTTLISP